MTKTASGLSPGTLKAAQARHNGSEPVAPLAVHDAVGSLDRGVLFQKAGLRFTRKLSFEEWEELGSTLRTMEGGVRWWLGDWCNYGEHAYGEKYAQALDATDASYGGLRNAAWVAGRIDLSRRRDNLSWSHHAELASLEPAEQDAWLDTAEGEEWSTRELRGALRESAKTASPALPEGTFSLIYADPPWRYDGSVTDSRKIENQYPTLDVDEICAFEDERGRTVQELVADDAVLFLWATNPKLREALAVIEAWGFEYRTNAVWVKHAIGMGYYFRQQHELLLVARKGDPGLPAESDRVSSVIDDRREEHSKKPKIHEYLERWYPDPPHRRVELFGREKREGWTVYGNEL